MFESPKIQITYNKRLQRVRLQFPAAECLKARKAPANIFKKIEERLASEKAEGHIETYAIFGKRFADLWQHLRREVGKSITEDHIIKFTAGQGARKYQEIVIERDRKRADSGLLLSCSFPIRKVINISFNSFVFNIVQRLEDLQPDFKVDRAQLRFIFLLLQAGHRVRDIKLVSSPKADDSNSSGYIVRINKRYGFVSLHIMHPDCLYQAKSLPRLWKSVLAKIDQLNQTNINFHLLKDHSLEKIESLSNKVQATGFNLPYDLLIGFDQSHQLNDEVANIDRLRKYQGIFGSEDSPQASEEKARVSPFSIEISADRLKAHISQCDQNRLDRLASDLDEAKIVKWIQQARIKFGFEAFTSQILAAIQNRSKLEGMLVAEGLAASSGLQPYVHFLSHNDYFESLQPLDIRNAQNKHMYLKGSRIAEIRYLDGEPGCDVFGNVVHAIAPISGTKFLAGKGIDIEKNCYFVAQRHGMAKVEEDMLALIDAYTHEGSVDLASGDLYFEGPTVIKGDIEAGAKVEVIGPLLVEGMIGPSQIKCQGSLEVKGGIMTGAGGSIRADGSIRCEFISNSNIELSQDLLVQRSILHSQVICGGRIRILDESEGMIAGGHVSSWGSILTANYGLEQTRQSDCRVGVDFKLEQAIVDQTRILAELRAAYSRLQKQAKGSGQDERKRSTQDRQELMNQLQETGEQLKALMTKIEKLESEMKWNPNASLLVSKRLDRRVNILISGRSIHAPTDLEAVIVLAQKHDNSHFIPMQTCASLKQARPDLDLMAS